MNRLVMLLLALSLPLAASADDWPRWRGINGDGQSAETGLLERWPAGGPKLLWAAGGLGKGWTSPSIADGKIFATGMVSGKGYLHCFDLTGKELWKVETGREWDGTSKWSFPGVHSTPTVVGEHLYLMSGYGVASCWKTADGAKVWEVDTFEVYGGRNIQWGISESPLIDGDYIYVTPGGPGASVVKLDRKTGKLVWKTSELSEKSAYCSPAIVKRGDTRVLVTMLENHVVGIDPANGKVFWKIPHRNRYAVHANTPLMTADGLLFCSSGYKQGSVAIQLSEDGKSAKVAWEKKILDCHFGGLVLIGNYVYATSSGRPKARVLCLDVTTGKSVAESRAVPKGAVIAAEGLLYCYGEDGTVALLKASSEGLESRGSFKITQGSGEHWSHPAISNGVLYIRRGSHLMAFDIKKK